IPDVKSNHFYSKFADGWWVATIVSIQTGFPLNVSLGTQRSLQNNSQDTDRPNLDPSFNYGSLITGGPLTYFNPTMFDVPAVGTLGNAPRNLLTSPHLRNADLSINKDTKLRWLGEAGAITFRAELFNFLNHTNYGSPNTTLLSASSATAPAT